MLNPVHTWLALTAWQKLPLLVVPGHPKRKEDPFLIKLNLGRISSFSPIGLCLKCKWGAE
jgi:hypothetical protein